MSFFSDTDDSPPPQPPSNRTPSAAASSFTDRLRSTISPALSHPPLGQPIPSSSSYDASGSRSRKEERAVSEFDEEAYYRELGIADDDEPEVPSTPTSNIFGSLSPARNIYGIPHDGAGRERVEAGFGMDLREGNATNWEEIDEEMEIEDMDDVRKMGLVWTRERGTTDIMPWEGELVDALLDKLEQQQKMVSALRSDPQTSEEEHFKLMLVQTEMERVKYLVRSYVRTRLHKIEKFSYHITLSPELHNLLSGAELSHAQRYTELLHTHFQHSVLDSLPESFRRLDETYGDGTSMVTKPNKQIPILIYVRKDCGEINLERFVFPCPSGCILTCKHSGEEALLAKGTTHLVKYSLIERWIKLGWVEVL
ncbi:hypothetical protein C349_04630 [Cryptococcus neoformans var. grubii Br795]|nr:hypothetical protein C349_04630 [Cryptococcus neoformans var. grubii Br795]